MISKIICLVWGSGSEEKNEFNLLDPGVSFIWYCCVIWGRWLQPPEKNVRQKVYQDYLQVCVCVCVCVCWSLSRVLLFVTPWTVARQAPLSMEFSRQEYWMGSLSLLQGIFLTQESNRGLLHCTRILYQLSLREVLYAEYIMQNAAQAGWSTSWNEDCQKKYQ